MTIAEETAKILLSINAITFSPQKPYRYSSGILSPVYSDHRLLMGYPKERNQIMVQLANEVWRLGMPDFVAGTAMGAIPYAALVGNLLNIPFLYVRNKPKDHGKQNLVEGLYKRGQTAIVIEDLISTGQSSLTTVNALRDVGCKIHHVVCITTYGMDSSVKNLRSAKVELYPLTNFSTIVNTAVKTGAMKQKDQKMVLAWLKDPKGWGKKMGFE